MSNPFKVGDVVYGGTIKDRFRVLSTFEDGQTSCDTVVISVDGDSWGGASPFIATSSVLRLAPRSFVVGAEYSWNRGTTVYKILTVDKDGDALATYAYGSEKSKVALYFVDLQDDSLKRVNE